MESNILSKSLEINTLRSKIINNRLRLRELKHLSKVQFRKENKRIFLLFDIAVILIILSNFGALLITNALVVKVEPEKEFYEVNIVTAEKYDFVEHPEANKKMSQFLFHIYVWTFMIVLYILVRNNIRSRYWFTLLGFYIIFYAIAFGTDFINDLGYYIGVKLYG